jgi:diguanylate cyclase (GGDEF)-like protein/PAS domain S-box-containing protein
MTGLALVMPRVLARILIVILVVFAPITAAAESRSTVTLGVLAFRPKPETQARWQATVDYLSARTGHTFILAALSYPELEAAISRRTVDFVLTNPAHYVLMTHRNGLSSPLATLVNLDNGLPIAQFGGVIATRAGRHDIARLADLKGKVVASPDTGSFGGYQMQAYELAQAGLSVADIRLLVTGMPHDTALYAMLEGRAAAAFVRTGVIESLIRDGRVDAGQIAVLNRRQVAGFPFRLSTRLYPEWNLSAMPQTDDQLARAVSQALFALSADHPASVQGGYRGWAIPADYEPVRVMMQSLRLPPFDAAPAFTPRDIIDKHWLAIVLTSAAGGAIVVLLFMLAARQKQLRIQEHRLSEERRQLLAALGEGVYGVDRQGCGTFFNPAALVMLGFQEVELLGQDQHQLIHHHYPNGEPYGKETCPIQLTLLDGKVRRCEEWFFRKDGGGFPVEMTTAPIEREGLRIGAVVVFHDISQRLAAQARDRLLVSALEAVPNGIVITDPQARIEWVNPAFESLTGYDHQEAAGRRPAELVKSGEHDQSFYATMWKTILAGQTWRGEVINKRRDGSHYHEELTIAPVLDPSGELRHFVGIKQDISERKRLEAELRLQASTDALTGLANRRHFLALLEQEMARQKRFGEPASALLMFDLDHFKQINDSHGHAAGDAVLRRFAELMQASLRKTDRAGRLGGEEFAILLIGADSQGALEFADRLRQQVAAEVVAFETRMLRVTVSVGMTRLSAADATVDIVLARADAALYQAKANGRNRVEAA